MRMSRATLHLALPMLAALAACALDMGSGTSKFAGCYDNSCVSAPVVVPGVPAFASLSASSSHSCAMTSTGEAWCWGDNSLGQLGDGTDQPRGAPVRVTGGVRFSSISAGSGFTCALAVDGTALCWGSGATGQLGQLAPELCSGGRVRCSRAPLALAGFAFTAITAGTRHACAVTTAGAAYCWGFNFLGETGSTAYGETITAPTRVPGSSIFASIGAGDSFTCALTTAGRS